jgi:hypothetical protein
MRRVVPVPLRLQHTSRPLLQLPLPLLSLPICLCQKLLGPSLDGELHWPWMRRYLRIGAHLVLLDLPESSRAQTTYPVIPVLKQVGAPLMVRHTLHLGTLVPVLVVDG